MRRLLLTGPPAAGKTTIGRLIAESRHYGAFIDVDDVRHMIVGGHAAPWSAEQGAHQQRLGVINACALARNFVDNGIEVVVADVLTNDTAALYRELLPTVLVLELVVDFQEAQRRSEQRPLYLTPDEFPALHDQQAEFTASDRRVNLSQLSEQETTILVRETRLSL